MKLMFKNICLFSFLIITIHTFGNDSIYLARQEAYINTSLQNNSGKKLTLQAFNNVAIDSIQLHDILADLPTKFNPDFEIVELVRVLFYSDSLYDDQILPVLSQIPYWINSSDTVRNYWTENHMIMWMSSEWLLHERYGLPVNNTTHQRLLHYLKLKKEYGFYEFFSSVYSPYALSGLLNLYEFTEDSVLKELSKDVAQQLLTDMLKPTTDLGVYFPSSSRSYPEKYNTAYNQNHNSLIYLLTGLGQTPTSASHAGAFLATSTLPVNDIINSWSSKLNTTITMGHSLENSFTINDSLNAIDKLIFQWSTSAYAHPLLIENTFQLLADSSLWQHKDWEALRPLSFISPTNAPIISEELKVLSYSSIISNHSIRLFKNNSVALMSITDLYKGKIGFQQWPFTATVGTTAVYTEAGKVNLNWGDRDRSIENAHLPHVEQKDNVALIMYRPEEVPDLLNVFAGDMIEDKEVGLFWQENAYDEIIEDGNWLLGRQDENYVAVRRSCTEKINTWWACETEDGQTWVVIVGDSSMYQSFSSFQNIIAQSTYTEEWYYAENSSFPVYYAQINVDTISVEYTWGNEAATKN